MVYTPNPSPSTYFFSAGFQVSAKFPPGSAGFCQVSPGFVGFPTGFRQPRASARLARSRQVCVKLFISYSQVSAKPPPSPTQDPSQLVTSHNLSVLFPKQFSAELSAQHCLPEGRRLLKQLCCEIKVRTTNLSSPTRGAGRWRPLTVTLEGAKSDNENPVCTWCLGVNY